MAKVNKLAATESFAVYYGQGREEELKEFDLVIVEPTGQTTSGLASLKEHHTIVLAYSSVIELPSWDEKNNLLSSQDYLWDAETIVTNPRNHNYWLDLRSKCWSRMFLHQTSDLLQCQEYDGLFLDTIGYIEDSRLPAKLRQELGKAAASLLYQIRSVFPETLLIQNGGLRELLPYTTPYIDGICWENGGLEESQEMMQKISTNLSDLKEQEQIKVLLLMEESICTDDGTETENKAISIGKRIAADHGFLFYQAPFNYLGRINVSS